MTEISIMLKDHEFKSVQIWKAYCVKIWTILLKLY